MSTQSAIGVIQINGKIRGIYCHYDGYVQGVGKKLQNFYNTQVKVEELIELGHLSKLENNINDTVAYGRDCLQSGQTAMLCENVCDFERYFSGSAFFYLFDGYEWSYRQYGNVDMRYKSLEEILNYIDNN